MGTKSIINKEPVDVIIPTYDNVDQLVDCVQSILATRTQYPVRIIVVNNGTAKLEHILTNEYIEIVNCETNLGWTGGLIEGLKHSNSKYVLFCNDDILVPAGSYRWLSQMIRHMELRPWIAAVGPSSNCVMGTQSIFAKKSFVCSLVPFLIGFCMLVRRSVLDEIGGIDPEFVTGDDIDLSIRFRQANHLLLADSSVFIFHHGFQTGEKLYGRPNVPGGWNSQQMTESTNTHLIQKFGFLEYWKFIMGIDIGQGTWMDERAGELNAVLKYVDGCPVDRIVDLGCGGSKTIEGSVGVDIIPKGLHVQDTAYNSDADIIADVEKKLPFEDGQFDLVIARQILEHCTDLVGALSEWKRIMSDNGTMIIAVPDERIADTIILNPEHVHAFTPDSLSKIVKCLGFEVAVVEECLNGDSFVLVLNKGL